MSGGGEYEPKDSRRVVGTKGEPGKSWREEEKAKEGRGEYEPRDARNVTGQRSSETDRWDDGADTPPDAAGGHPSAAKKRTD
jgi:hypothetical protein